MEGLRAADIVLSSAGHDSGKIFVVLETWESRALIADGKTRKLAAPKTKSLKHISFIKAGEPGLYGALERREATDRLIRRELAKVSSEFGNQAFSNKA